MKPPTPLAIGLVALLFLGFADAGFTTLDVPLGVDFLVLDPAAVRQTILQGLPVAIPFQGMTFFLQLEPYDDMAPGAKILTLAEDNTTLVEIPKRIIIFRGHDVNDPSTVASLTITENWVGGSILLLDGGSVFIEEAAAFADDADVRGRLSEHEDSGVPGILHVLYSAPNLVRASDREAVATMDFSALEHDDVPRLDAASSDVDPNGPVNEACAEATGTVLFARDLLLPRPLPDATDLIAPVRDPGTEQVEQYLAPVDYILGEAVPDPRNPWDVEVGLCDNDPERLPVVEDPAPETDNHGTPGRGQWTDIRKAQLGIVVDYEYLNTFGRMTWSDHARKLLEQMNSIYRRDVGMIFESTGFAYDGALTSEDWGTLMNNQLRDPQTGIEHLVAALLGKDMDSAAIGTVDECTGTKAGAQMMGDARHGWSTPNEDFERVYVLAHELGHDLHYSTADCGHDESQNWIHYHYSCDGYCHWHSTLMQTSAWAYHEHKFSDAERASIRSAAVGQHNLPTA